MVLRIPDRIKAFYGKSILNLLWLTGCVCRGGLLRHLYERALMRLVLGTGLFDGAFYLATNSDVSGGEEGALRHYVAYGDREGRQPMPFIDPVFYRSRVAGRAKRVNALLHYALVGRYLRISPSPWFDVSYYLARNKDVARAQMEPLRHFRDFGGFEGRSPNPYFDSAYYLKSNPEVSESGINPLAHYITVGRFLGRETMPPTRLQTNDDYVEERNVGALLDSLAPISCDATPVVDVVIPVYKSRELTLRCIYSVLVSTCDTPYELVVIDDCSPDTALKADLEMLARRRLITLIRNSSNLGYVGSVNRGISLHPERDVILLNSDTRVYNDWIDRLSTVAYSRSRIATVTPLSNNATICSYPHFLHDNPYPLEMHYRELDALAARVNHGISVEAPTGVGFCIYLRRDALVDVGDFDEKLFGKGYGEENDFCQRAILKGWKNLIAGNVFVAHLGGGSFQGEKAMRVTKAMQIMKKHYPDYLASVERFVQADPLADARKRLDMGRLRAHVRDENVLILCHNRGGGAERAVLENSEMLRKQGKGVFFLRPLQGNKSAVKLSHPDCRKLINLPTLSLADTRSLVGLLKDLNISVIHSHGLVDFEADAPEQVLALARAMSVPLHVTIHDYKVICPRINLVDGNGRYCGEKGIKACNRCLLENGNDFGVKNIMDWRARHERVLRQCAKIFVPDPDVENRLLRYFPGLKLTLVPHEAISEPHRILRRPVIGEDEYLRIVVIGGIGKHKGFHVLLRCARFAKKRGQPLEFLVMGYSHDDRQLRRAGVLVTGRYQEKDAERILRELAPHVVWLPSIWPETYSYTLSLALQGGYDVFAFNIGAIANRLKEARHGKYLLPMEFVDKPYRINNRFIAYRKRHLK